MDMFYCFMLSYQAAQNAFCDKFKSYYRDCHIYFASEIEREREKQKLASFSLRSLKINSSLQLEMNYSLETLHITLWISE